MEKIYKITKGHVTPNDFYSIPEKETACGDLQGKCNPQGGHEGENINSDGLA